MENEKLLIEGLKSANQTSFRSLVEEYQDKVFCTCLGLLHDRDDADDITQEVFIEVFHSIKKFKGESKLSTWLCSIAVNKSLNFIRSKKRRVLFQSLGLIPIPELSENEVNFDESYELSESKKRKRILWNAINSLSEKQKAAFILHKITELKYSEIAQTLGISLSSVESLIFRAKTNLQKKLCDSLKNE